MPLRKSQIIVLCIVALPPVLLLSFLIPAILKRDNPDYFARENIATISAALNKYRSSYGTLPAGDNAAIFRTLEGANTTGEIFIETIKTNAVGEVLDSWGTPYQIQFDGATNFVVRSAGRDKVLGDADDVVFDSAKKGFVSQQ